MKITVKIPKPRNPLAVLVRQRSAGSHEARMTRRHQRRTEKQALRGWVQGSRKGEIDA